MLDTLASDSLLKFRPIACLRLNSVDGDEFALRTWSSGPVDHPNAFLPLEYRACKDRRANTSGFCLE
jgi:hypothetical protein